jgi:hypothetical protein
MLSSGNAGCPSRSVDRLQRSFSLYPQKINPTNGEEHQTPLSEGETQFLETLLTIHRPERTLSVFLRDKESPEHRLSLSHARGERATTPRCDYVREKADAWRSRRQDPPIVDERAPTGNRQG